MDELREEIERMVENRLRWAGHVERMAADRLTKTANAYIERGRQEEKRRTAIEGKSSRQKRMEAISSEGD